MKQSLLKLILAIFVLAPCAQSQEPDYPVAMPTDHPDIVTSPYDANRKLDVAGMTPGSLAVDPVSEKYFRVPYSNSVGRYYEDRKVEPPVRQPEPAPREQPETTPPVRTDDYAPSWQPPSNAFPQGLLEFVRAFNLNSSSNDPDALTPFYAEQVSSYFGKKNMSREAIRKDRVAYIKRFPQREYVLDGEPLLVASDGNIYEVMTRVSYSVRGSGRHRTGSVADYLKIRAGRDGYRIVAIAEAKAGAPPKDVVQQDLRRTRERIPQPTRRENRFYGRYEIASIEFFLDAFAASGEANEPSASVDFMHPQMTNYYGKKNPNRADLLEDRSNYIRRWPNRRYWLAEKPEIRRVGDAWEVASHVGYDVKRGAERKQGEAISLVRLVNTPDGLKIMSIAER